MNEEWKEVRLSDVAEILMGQSPPGDSYNTVGEGLPFLQGSAEFGTQTPVPQKWCSKPLKMATEGDLLMSVRAPVGDTNFADQQIAIGRGLAILRGRDAALTHFLRLVIQSKTSELVAASGSGMFASITGANLRNFRFVLPPILVQRRIVDLMTHLDAHIANLQAERNAAGEVLIRLCEASESSSVPLGERVRARGGKRMPKGEPFSVEPTEHPYLRVIDMQDGTFLSENLAYVPDAVWPAIKRYTVKEGDLVISIVGTIGRVSLVPRWADGANLTENAATIDVLSPQLDVRWLGHWLRTEAGQREIERVTVGTSQGKLALSRIPLIEVPDLSLEDQQRLGVTADETQALCSRLSQEVASLEAFRGRTLAALLSGRLTIPESYQSILPEVA